MNILLIGFLLAFSMVSIQAVSISGSLTGRSSNKAPVIVQAYDLEYDPVAKQVIPLYVHTVFLSKPSSQVRVTEERFVIQNLKEGNYSLLAYEDVNGDGTMNLGAPIGWWGSNFYAGFPHLSAYNNNVTDADIILKKSTPYNNFTKGPRGGSLSRVKGFNVLNLKGDADDRGYDHGFLAGRQILDWFRFYVLEQLVAPKDYLTEGLNFLKNVMYMDNEFIQEGNSVLQGMIDSGLDMHIPELQKQFDIYDLFSITSYIELGAAQCSQFVLWGNNTVDGNLIAGRNMDGEIDVRKVTVSHLTIFAIDPTEPNQNKFVSIMWPGFLGTLTGFNEHGLYGMMNTGLCAQGPQVSKAQPVAWTMRNVLQTLTAETASPQNTLKTINAFKSSGGGISTSGTVFVFARNNTEASGPLGFVFEGDKYGGLMRTPNEVDPYGDEFIMATNHFKVYGANPYLPDENFGSRIADWSLARYSVGSAALSSWERNGHKANVNSFQDLLQRVAHGQTEHSVIWTPNDRAFYVSNSKWEPTQWDAPYLDYTQFYFDELFQ